MFMSSFIDQFAICDLVSLGRCVLVNKRCYSSFCDGDECLSWDGHRAL